MQQAIKCIVDEVKKLNPSHIRYIDSDPVPVRSSTVAAVLRRIYNRRAVQSWRRIARMWSEDLEPTELLIEAFGLGRYIGAACDGGELAIPLDIFKVMAQRYDVSLEKLIKAYVKGALDAAEEKTET